MAKGKDKKKTGGNVNSKAVHVANLVSKRNWPQIRKMAAEGIQEAVDALSKRQNAAAAVKDTK